MSQRHPERHTVSQRQAAPGECFDQPTYLTRKLTGEVRRTLLPMSASSVVAGQKFGRQLTQPLRVHRHRLRWAPARVPVGDTQVCPARRR